MTISDIITLISLVIAIVAIISEKNRKHLLLMFNIVDYLIFVVSFLLINYFVFYDCFYNCGFYFNKLYCTNFGLNNPKNYAYIITILTLLYLLYKFLCSFYPYCKIEKVIKNYEQLIENSEISFLLDLIERYHKSNIIKYIERTRDYNPNDNWFDHLYRSKDSFVKKLNKLLEKIIRYFIPCSWFNRKIYGACVLHRVFDNPAFLTLASNKRPYLFAEIFVHFKASKQDGFPKELINTFLSELIKQKNFWLKKELQESQKNDFGQPEWFYRENKILSALLQDLSVADVNEVWIPFGNAAIDEIEEERIKGFESKMFQEFRDEKYLWEFKTTYAIQFLKIIVIEILEKRFTNSRIYLYYYSLITDTILETFNKYPLKEHEKFQTVYHEFINIMINNCFWWLKRSNDKDDDGFYTVILYCLGSILHSVCKTSYFSQKEKIRYIDSLYYNYCNLKNNSHSEELRKKIGETILKPIPNAQDSDDYYIIAENAWNKFDKIPHRVYTSGSDCEYFKRFKQEVIIPLGLDPELP